MKQYLILWHIPFVLGCWLKDRTERRKPAVKGGLRLYRCVLSLSTQQPLTSNLWLSLLMLEYLRFPHTVLGRIFAMSGHSKWHSIRHKKAAVDAKRGRMFTRLIKEITVSARLGGGDADSNPKLRTAVQAAKSANMPQDNIKRAIMKGTGELPGVNYESITYEGYGPGGAAVLVECLTDNRNRTVADIRHIFSKYGGNLGETGSVNWMFERKGYLCVRKESVSEDQVLEIVLEAGAEDLQSNSDSYEVYTSFEQFESVRQALETARFDSAVSELTMIPSSEVKLEGKIAARMLTLMETLEDHEDVQHAYANFDIDEAEMLAFASA